MMQMPDTDPAWFRIGIREMTPGMISNPGQVWSRVQDIFTEFCQSGSRFAAANAYWLTEPLDPLSVKPHELVVYLISDSTKSLIRQFFRAQFNASPPGANSLGLTAVGGAANLSEIYVQHSFHQNQPVLIANTIVHELMHNKLNMGDSMHNLAPFVGGAGGFMQENLPAQSMAEKMLRQNLETTRVDRTTMGPKLADLVPQKLV